MAVTRNHIPALLLPGVRVIHGGYTGIASQWTNIFGPRAKLGEPPDLALEVAILERYLCAKRTEDMVAVWATEKEPGWKLFFATSWSRAAHVVYRPKSARWHFHLGAESGNERGRAYSFADFIRKLASPTYRKRYGLPPLPPESEEDPAA